MLFSPQDLIVFMVGGVSYAEAREVYKINAANTGTRIILGGTTIHNTKRYAPSASSDRG